MITFHFNDTIDSLRLLKNHQHWFSSHIISPFDASRPVSSSYIRLRNNKMKGKKKKEKKSNKGASTENSGRNGKILFFHSSRGRRWRDEVRAVFSEKIHHPRRHPRQRRVDLYFFHPCPPTPSHRRYILLPMANAGLANFETKTSAESKTKLVLRLFAIAKQGRCKTTIKTLVREWKITFHQSHRYFSVCYIALWC